MKRLFSLTIFFIFALGTRGQVINPGGGGGSGTVTSVSGTTNQVDVATGTTTPIISIDPAFVFPGTASSKIINGVSYSALYTGATLDVRVNAAMSDAHGLANGNTSGHVSSVGEPSGSTINAPITVLTNTLWQLPVYCSWQIDMGGQGGVYAINQDIDSTIWGPGNGAGSCLIHGNSGGYAGVYTTVGTGRFRAEGFQVNDGQHSLLNGATMTVSNAEDGSYFGHINVETLSSANKGLYITGNNCCQVTFDQIESNSVYLGGIPIYISSGGGGISFRNLSADHPTASEPIIQCVTSGTVSIVGLYEEGYDGVTSGPVNDINGCSRFTISGEDTENYLGNAGNNAPIWQVENSGKPSVTISGLVAGGYASGTLAVNNLANATQVPVDSNGNLSSYSSNTSYVDNLSDLGLSASSHVCTTSASVLSTTVSNCPKASNSVFGLAEVDGTTITSSGGVLTAVTGGSGTWAGSGTTGTLPIATATTTLGNSNETEAGGVFNSALPFTSTGLITGVGLTTSGKIINSAAGAASTPALSMTGTPFSGSNSSAVPLLYLNGGTAPTSWQLTGTYFGINEVSGFTGDAIDVHANGGASVFSVYANGLLTAAGQGNFGSSVSSSYEFINANNGGYTWTNSKGGIYSPANNTYEFINLANTFTSPYTVLEFGCNAANTCPILSTVAGTTGLSNNGALAAGGKTPVGIGTPTQIYNTAAVSQTASIGATTMVANPAADESYRFSVYVGQLNAGVTCTLSGSVGVNVIYTDAITGNVYTVSLPLASSVGTALSTTVPLTSSTPAVANVGWAQMPIRAKASTNVQYSTTYAAGSGCGTGQAYNIYPVLEAE